MKQYDDTCYNLHEECSNNHCFHCSKELHIRFIMRHEASMKLVCLCEECMLGNLSDYYLDNTGPWTGKK